MLKPISRLLVLAFALVDLSSAVHADDAALTQRISVLERQVTALQTENKSLRTENAQLKQRLAEAKGSGASVAAIQPPQSALQPAKAKAAESGYWITMASGKRHNSGCRYFQNSKGRPCGPDEGVACKLCGG